MQLQQLVSNLFPSLASKVQQDTEQIQDPEVLQHLIIEIAVAQTAEEAIHLIDEATSKR